MALPLIDRGIGIQAGDEMIARIRIKAPWFCILRCAHAVKQLVFHGGICRFHGGCIGIVLRFFRKNHSHIPQMILDKEIIDILNIGPCITKGWVDQLGPHPALFIANELQRVIVVNKCTRVQSCGCPYRIDRTVDCYLLNLVSPAS